MYSNNYDATFSLSTGLELEDEMYDSFEYHFKKSGPLQKEVFRRAAKEEDYKLGTDAFIYGLPVDFTCNFAGKNHMVDTEVSMSTPFGEIKFGVRTGNGRVSFSQPVLVIGVDTDFYLKKNNIPSIISAVSKRVEEIISTGTDAYWDCCDELGLE